MASAAPSPPDASAAAAGGERSLAFLLRLALIGGIGGMIVNGLRLLVGTATVSTPYEIVAWPVVLGGSYALVRARPHAHVRIIVSVCAFVVAGIAASLHAALHAPPPHEVGVSLAGVVHWSAMPTLIAFLLCPLRHATVIAVASIAVNTTVLVDAALTVPGMGDHETRALAIELVMAMVFGAYLMMTLGGLRMQTERQRAAMPQLQRRAERDALTGVLNRRAFLAHVQATLQQRQPQRRLDDPHVPGPAVLMIDLDHFKAVNDRHGHAVGDQVLREFGAVLMRCCARGQVAARLGGEEFAVLCEQPRAGSAERVVARLRHALASRTWPRGLRITVSIGLAHAMADDTEPMTVLARADAALYEAKADGRNCCHRAGPHPDGVGRIDPAAYVGGAAGGEPTVLVASSDAIATGPAAGPAADRPARIATARARAAGTGAVRWRRAVDRPDAAQAGGEMLSATAGAAVAPDRRATAQLTATFAMMAVAVFLCGWLDGNPANLWLHVLGVVWFTGMACVMAARGRAHRTFAETAAVTISAYLFTCMGLRIAGLPPDCWPLIVGETAMWGQLLYIGSTMLCRNAVTQMIGAAFIVAICVGTGIVLGVLDARGSAWMMTIISNALVAFVMVAATGIVARQIHDRHLAVSAQAQRVWAEARTDPLTGLPNRHGLLEALPALRDAPDCAVAVVDLDHFKRVNDTHGHAVGDDVLRRFASLLRASAVGSECCGRWGGEEFVVVAPVPVHILKRRLEHLRREIACADWPAGLVVTASIGIADAAEPSTMRDALERADAAMYEAKRSGRDRIVLAPGTTPAAVATAGTARSASAPGQRRDGIDPAAAGLAGARPAQRATSRAADEAA